MAAKDEHLLRGGARTLFCSAAKVELSCTSLAPLRPSPARRWRNRRTADMYTRALTSIAGRVAASISILHRAPRSPDFWAYFGSFGDDIFGEVDASGELISD